MNFPYFRFLKFLVSRKHDVATALKRLRLPRLDWQDELALKNRLRGGVLPPVVDAYFRSNNVTIAGSQAFLAWAESEEMAELWGRQPEFAQRNDDLEVACRAFANPAMRTVLALLIMSGFDNEELSGIVYQRSEVKLSVPSIELFKKLFWDVRLMRRQDWLSLLDDLEKEQGSLLAIAFQGKGRPYVKMALGVIPELELRDVLTTIMTKAVTRFNELMELPAVDESMAISWANLAMRAGEKRKNAGGGPSRNLTEDLQLQLEHDDGTDFPTLAELSAGAAAVKPSGN